MQYTLATNYNIIYHRIGLVHNFSNHLGLLFTVIASPSWTYSETALLDSS